MKTSEDTKRRYSRSSMLWMVVVFASVAWQPFRLGFYLDDWGAVAAAARHGGPFSWTRFVYLNNIDPHRPVLGPLRLLFSSLLSDSPFLWHIALLCASALTALILGRVAVALSSQEQSQHRVLIYSIAASWLVLPWAIAFRVWSNFLVVQLALICFGCAMYLVFLGWRDGRPRILLPSLLYLFACLGYEAFQFQLVPIILIGILLVRAGRASARHVFVTSAGLIAAQTCALGWIFATNALALWSRKSIQPGWMGQLKANVRDLAPQILISIRGARPAFGLCLAGLTVLTGIVSWRAWKSPATRSDALVTLGQAVCCLMGGALSLVIFTMGGRPVFATGVETRVLSLASAWSVLAACLLGAFLWRNSSGAMRRTISAAAVGLGLCLVVGNFLRAQEWGEAWREQQSILSGAPVPEMLKAQPGAAVLYAYPLDVNGAPIFAAPWDINWAMPLRHPGTERLRFVVYPRNLGPLVWTGKDLRYPDGSVVQDAPALYVWRPRDRSFYRAVRPFRMNPDLSVEELFTGVQAGTPSEPLHFVPRQPCRVVDTRNPGGPFSGPAIAGGSTRNFALPAGACNIPLGALAYSVNVSVFPQGALGYLSIWPTGQPEPIVSTLNSLDGRQAANAAIVPAGADGSVSVFASDATHVVLDVNGYFVPAGTPGALAFYPLTPCRVMDTRGGTSIGAGGTRTVPVRSSSCGVPSGAVAYALNFTALPHGPLGWITTWPTGSAMPTASTLNAPTGAITANAAILPAGTGGSVDVYASSATDLLVDINGYFAPPGTGGLSFSALAPCRVADTRNPNGPFGGPALVGTRDFAVAASACGVPSGAKAYSLNATAWPAGSLNRLTLWPTGSAMPVVSTLLSWDGRLVANAALVPTTNGSISVYASDSTTFLLDINGYFAP